MAQLAEKSYEVPEFTRSENWKKISNEQEKLLMKLMKESKKATEKNPVGFVMKFPVADGLALYRVVKAKPLTLQHIPISDAYQIPSAHLRGLNMADVKQQLKWNREEISEWSVE